MKPLVSICIPVYNGEKFLSEAIDCALDQTYDNIEIIVVDDQSTDTSVQVIQKYQKLDDRIRYVANEQNIGLVGNWNGCLELVRGDWIKFHFQDDLMERDCIERLYQSAIANEVNLVLCRRRYFGTNSLQQLKQLSDFESKSRNYQPEHIVRLFNEDYLGSNFLGEPIAGLFSKELIQKYGVFDHHLKQLCDFEYWLRIALNEPIHFLNHELVSFRVHNMSETSRNMQRKGVSPFVLDRVYLARTLLQSDHYKYYREKTPDLSKKQEIKIRELLVALSFVSALNTFTTKEILGAVGAPNKLAQVLYRKFRLWLR
ncbi:MAG: glycosyltransferase family 2 protein [Cyclobacteriaceae bacterium]